MSQSIFKMSSTGSNTGMQTSALLVNDTLFQYVSHINQMLLQIIHVMHFNLVHPLLNYAPHLVVN